MTNITERDKSLASLALFSQLYEEQKDVMSVLRDFVKQSIMNHGQLEVSSADICAWLNNDYGFEIPNSVVGAVLWQCPFLEKLNHVNYRVISTTFTDDAIQYEQNFTLIKKRNR